MRTTTERRLTFDAALLILAVGFAFSLAANLLWTWQGGVVRILGGALASLALPGAIHLWPRIPVAAPVSLRIAHWTVDVPVMRAVRALAMTGIACMAAFTTFSHASALLVFHGETPLLATLYPVMTELLVVMGVLARHTTPTPSAAEQSKPRRRVAETVRDSQTTPSVRDTPAPTETPRGKKLDAATEWARAQPTPPSGKAIQFATGISRAQAFNIAKLLREEAS